MRDLSDREMVEHRALCCIAQAALYDVDRVKKGLEKYEIAAEHFSDSILRDVFNYIEPAIKARQLTDAICQSLVVIATAPERSGPGKCIGCGSDKLTYGYVAFTYKSDVCERCGADFVHYLLRMGFASNGRPERELFADWLCGQPLWQPQSAPLDQRLRELKSLGPAAKRYRKRDPRA